jgi:hypothetical protein
MRSTTDRDNLRSSPQACGPRGREDWHGQWDYRSFSTHSLRVQHNFTAYDDGPVHDTSPVGSETGDLDDCATGRDPNRWLDLSRLRTTSTRRQLSQTESRSLSVIRGKGHSRSVVRLASFSGRNGVLSLCLRVQLGLPLPPFTSLSWDRSVKSVPKPECLSSHEPTQPMNVK